MSDNLRHTDYQQSNYRSIALFLFFSFFIPLICIILLETCPVFHSGISNLILFGIEGTSPFLAVFIVLWIQGGRKKVQLELHKKYFNNLSIKYVFLAIVIPLLILTLAKLTILCMYPKESFLHPITMKKLLIISWALIAEELGWRGFLQEKLDSILPTVLVPFTVGIIWTMWHYHFILSGSMSIPLLAFLFGCIFESYGYYAITRLSKGNIIPASLWHFTGNLFFNLYRFDPSWNHGDTTMYWITTLFYSLSIMIFLFTKKRFHK